MLNSLLGNCSIVLPYVNGTTKALILVGFWASPIRDPTLTLVKTLETLH